MLLPFLFPPPSLYRGLTSVALSPMSLYFIVCINFCFFYPFKITWQIGVYFLFFYLIVIQWMHVCMYGVYQFEVKKSKKKNPTRSISRLVKITSFLSPYLANKNDSTCIFVS